MKEERVEVQGRQGSTCAYQGQSPEPRRGGQPVRAVATGPLRKGSGPSLRLFTVALWKDDPVGLVFRFFWGSRMFGVGCEISWFFHICPNVGLLDLVLCSV